MAKNMDDFLDANEPEEVVAAVETPVVEDAPEVMVPLRYVSDYNSLTDQWTSRFDTGYGISPMYNEGAVRVNA